MAELSLHQFQYDLPDERIARFPLPQRDHAKLLVYRSGNVAHHHFYDLPALLPEGSFLVFNDSKVIPARLPMTRATGAHIELFLLSPVPEFRPITEAMQDAGQATWQCMVGNRKRWPAEEVLTATFGDVQLTAEWADYATSHITLRWQPAERPFAEVIQRAGEVPLPPYLKRAAVEADRETYQTVYSKNDGSVAAPTAGLHFTPTVFQNLKTAGFGHDYLTLHVGAGTFQPIKTDDPREHLMHTEQVVYTRRNIENFLKHHATLLPVGTTSMRSLESLYWIGVKLLRNEPQPTILDQHYAYNLPADQHPAPRAALEAVLRYLDTQEADTLLAHTGIYITPGYQLKMCRGLITNFHQPGSTLILLIATLLGNDWRRVYDEALRSDYRFLSYGDSSLLLP